MLLAKNPLAEGGAALAARSLHRGADGAHDTERREPRTNPQRLAKSILTLPHIRATAGILRRLSPAAASLRIKASHNDWFIWPAAPHRRLAKTTYNCCLDVGLPRFLLNFVMRTLP